MSLTRSQKSIVGYVAIQLVVPPLLLLGFWLYSIFNLGWGWWR